MPASHRDGDHRRAEVRLKVFGAMRLVVDGREIRLAPPRLAQVIAVLALAGGAPVRTETLVDALWTENPPASAVNQLHRLIGQARRLFEPHLDLRAAGSMLLGSGPTYHLALSPDELDLLGFRRMLGEARDASPAERLQGYLGALRIAHAPAAMNLSGDGVIGAFARRIERDRVRAFLDAVALEPADPDSIRSLLEVAVDLAERHPLDEAVQEARARVLLAAGQRTLALDLIRSTEDRLRTELGVGAGERLKATYVDALRADEDAGHRASALPLPVALRSLFLPRPDLAARLDAAADDAGEEGALAVVSGMGGIGKTTIVCEWARSAAERFHDGVLYFDARGVNPAIPAADSTEAMTTILRSLGAGSAEDPTAYRTVMRSRELILILDNVPNAEFVRDLLPRGGRSLIVAISRSALPGLVAREGAFALPVGTLSNREGAELVAMRMSRQGAMPTTETIERVLGICAGLPLALTIACARDLRQFTVGSSPIAHKPHAGSYRLDLLSLDNPDASLRTTLSWSVDRLSGDAVTLFRSLAAYPGASCSIAAAESLLGEGSRTANEAISELLSASLLTVDERGRLQMHDLLRAMAGERLEDEERFPVERRLVQHFVRTGALVIRASLGRDLDLTGIESGPAEAIDDAASATDWFFEQKAVVTEVVWIAVRRGFDLEAALLGAGFSFMISRLFAPDRDLALFEALVASSDRSGRGAIAMSARARLAERYEPAGRVTEAKALWSAATAWARSHGTDENLADVLRAQGAAALHRRDRDLGPVLEILSESIEASRRVPGGPALAIGLIFYGDALRQAGRLQAAAAAFEEIGGLPAAPPFYRAVSFSFLATTWLELDRLPEAIEAARTSLQLLAAAGQSDPPTLAFQVLATASLRLGDLGTASEACAGFRRAWTPDALARGIARQAAAGEDVNSPFAIAPIAAEILRVERALDATIGR
jgi:DNA-binding SARP family transcriptional activator/tetratricopeptide (TPR) repeat protein